MERMIRKKIIFYIIYDNYHKLYKIKMKTYMKNIYYKKDNSYNIL